MSKDIGEYNTCPHLCHYCYANTNNATALANWNRHCECPHAETITEDTDVSTVHVVKGNILKDQIGVQQVSFSVTFAYLRQEIGGDGDDLGLLQRLKEREYSKGAFNAAFAEVADGDALIAHYGYGISYFCTNDRAAKAGGQSVFSQSNRSLLRERLGIRIVCPAELANIIEGALYGR